MSMQEKIERAVVDNNMGWRPNGDITDAIIAALPDMIEPLVWGVSQYLKKDVSGRYTVQHEYDANGGSCWVMGFDDWVVSTHHHRDIAQQAANTHHRAQIMAAFGVKL